MGGILHSQWLKYMEVEIVRGCVYMIYFIVGLLGVICAQNTIVLARDVQVRDLKNVVRYEAFVLVDDEPLL